MDKGKLLKLYLSNLLRFFVIRVPKWTITSEGVEMTNLLDEVFEADTSVDNCPDSIEMLKLNSFQLFQGSNWCFSFASELVGYSAPRDLHCRAAYSICESWFFIHQDVYHDLFVCS